MKRRSTFSRRLQIEFEAKFDHGESYVSVRVAATHFNTSVGTMYRLAESGKIPSYKIGGSRCFKISEMEAAFRA